MSKPDPTSLVLPRDWFLSAIEADGSVDACLMAVAGELQGKVDFITELRQRLKGPTAAVDAVTDLRGPIKVMENTLRFRLSVLSPLRPGAWYRPAAATVAGPFAGGILAEPVFGPHSDMSPVELKAKILAAWEKRSTALSPFASHQSCLWQTLIVLAEKFEQIDCLQGRFNGLRLSILPEDLPMSCESRSLRAFLERVRDEMRSLWDHLILCYEMLLRSCEEVWVYQEAQLKKQHEKTSHAWKNAAQDAREKMRQRRQASRLTIKTGLDLEALKFMGFEEYPEVGELKKRYLSLAKKMHPDAPGGSESKFKQLSRWYRHLLMVVEKLESNCSPSV